MVPVRNPARTLLRSALLRSVLLAAAGAASLGTAPAFARDNLGMYGPWGAFRDPAVPRCYAIAMADPPATERERQPYLAIGTWTRRGVRNQFHARLSRQLAGPAHAVLAIDGQHFPLTGNGIDAWGLDKRMDAAIVAAMRSARTLRISGRDRRGRPFVDLYPREGAATARDAATLGGAAG